MSKTDTGALAHKVRRLAHLDIPGAGQVTVAGRHAYIGHIPNKEHLGTTDRAIIVMRQLLLEAVRDVAAGAAPRGTSMARSFYSPT